MKQPSPPSENLGKYRYELRIPKDRIAVLVGTNGDIKKRIETDTKSKIEIDSKEGDIFIEGEDVVSLIVAREIIQAIGRGFNPETAFLLNKPDFSFEMISLNDYSREKNHQQRLKGRVIGKDGRARELIEEYCECYISVYGKTISIIGEMERCALGARAVVMLLEGSPHAGVYKWLEKKRKTLRMNDLGAEAKSAIKDEFKKYVD